MKDVTVTDVTTLVSFDGVGFDATRASAPTLVTVGDTTYLYYAGLPFSNRQSIGLATSDGGDFVKLSDTDPLISNFGSTPFTELSLAPQRVFYDANAETAPWSLYVFGQNKNLSTDPGTRGIGLATSQDGLTWTLQQTPLLAETGPSQGYSLNEIVKVDGAYIAYITDLNPDGPTEQIATSPDGMTFSALQAAGYSHDARLLTATEQNGGVIALFRTDDPRILQAAVSPDGLSFNETGKVTVPDGLVPSDLVVEGDQVAVYAGRAVGNVSWSFGNSVSARFDVPLALFTPEPAPPIAVPAPTTARLKDLDRTYIDGLVLPVDSAAYGVEEWRIRSVFNHRPDYFADQTHLGIDLNWGSGEDDSGHPIVAMLPVLDAAYYTFANGTLIVHHELPGGGVITAAYLHVQLVEGFDPNAAEFDPSTVKAGDVIATLSPGNAHLHFGLLEGKVDPVSATYGTGADSNIHWIAGQTWDETLTDSGLRAIQRLQRITAPETESNTQTIVQIDPVEFFAKHSLDFQVFLEDTAPASPVDGAVQALAVGGSAVEATLRPALLQQVAAREIYKDLEQADIDAYQITLDKGQSIFVDLAGVETGGLPAHLSLAMTIRAAEDFDTRLPFERIATGTLDNGDKVANGGTILAEFMAPDSGVYYLRIGNGDVLEPGLAPRYSQGGYRVQILDEDPKSAQFNARATDAAGPAPADLSALRDYDGNDLGAAEGWRLIGAVDVQFDGDVEYIFVNPEIARWATLGPDASGAVDFTDHGQGGETRVVGIYIDPEVAKGNTERFSDFDSQQRFQNDLAIDNLTVLDAFDFDNDGFQEIYFKVNDGTAYLRALMHADGNIQYANYQNTQQVEAYLTGQGFGQDVLETILL